MGFGYSTDYEIAVAPRVVCTVQASQLMPQQIINGDTICVHTPLTFTNTSSKLISHRMYNLLEFYHRWNQPGIPLLNSPPNGWLADTCVTWKFDLEDNGVGGRYFLAYNNTPSTITFITDSVTHPSVCTDQNFLRVNLVSMRNFGFGNLYNFNEQFVVCTDFCNGETIGIKSFNNYHAIKAYPNPGVNGKTAICGLLGKNTISVYNLMGQLLYSEVSEQSKHFIDL